MSADYDIVICGAGPVGLALAGLLVQRGVAANRLLLIDAKTNGESAADPRSIALSFGSRQILERTGAWPIPAQAIEQIHVSRRGHFGRTLIDRADYQVPALGYVTRYGALVTALTAVVQRAGITIQRPTQILATHESPDAVTVTLSDTTSITTGLLIQAEGGVFTQQPARSLHRDYHQSAVVTQVTCSAPLMQRAFERFTAEGPLALLPQDDGYAVVWCAATATASTLAQMTDPDFLQALQKMFGDRIGRFLTVGPRHLYPLGLNAHVASTARTAAIGNAAQTLHPVAGQGLNLGLRDATVLAQLLSQSASPAMLAAFLKARQSDRGMAIRITDTMARIFATAPDGALSQGILGLSLGMIDLLSPVKRVLAEQMMFGRR